MKDIAEILAEHYQKTYELTYELWKQRNQTFLILLAVIGAATLLTFSPTQTNPLLVRWSAKVLDVTDKQDIRELGRSFPFGLLHSLLLVVVGLVICIVVSLFCLAYARSSVSMDTEKAVLCSKGLEAAK